MTLELLISARDTLTKATLYVFEDVEKSIQMFKYIKKADQYVSFFNQEQTKLFDQYGVIQDDDITISPEKVGEYNKALAKILSTRIDDMPVFPIDEDEFSQAVPPKNKDMRLSVSDLIVMEKLRKED